MFPQMPTKQVVAMILATNPSGAAKILLGMTPDRLSMLLTEIPPANLGQIVSAASARDKSTLIANLSPTQRWAALSTLTTTGVARLLVALPPELAWTILGDVRPEIAASIFAELPSELRLRLENGQPPDLLPEFAAALYRRAAVDTIVRTASHTAWLDERAGDVMAEVLGKSIQISVRYRSSFALEGADILTEARRARWDKIAGQFTNKKAPANHDQADCH